MAENLRDDRTDYSGDRLDVEGAPADPMELFDAWMASAFAAKEAGDLPEPTAMQLGTVNENGQPSVRTVLLKDVSNGCFVFFTNYESDKGNQLSSQSRAALHFHWQAPLSRQIRIEGQVARVSRETSETYFATRPRKSQLAAWTSHQSRQVSGLQELQDSYGAIEAKFAGRDVPCPPHWGGYKLRPTRIEFWQGQRDRLHDRVLYRRVGTGWEKGRLAP